MKLIRWGTAGQEKPGLVDVQGRIRDLSGVVPDITAEVLSPAGLAALRALDVDRLPEVPAGTRFGVPVASVSKIVCVGLNYADHAAESNMPIPQEPVLFLKATSSLTGPDDEVVIPRDSEKTDWEVELGVVIGSRASYVDAQDALAHVAGYCVVNDVSERAFQLERGGQWDKGKGCDTFSPVGPWLVTPDEVPDPAALRLWLKVNDRMYQNGSTATMIFGVAHLVSYISQFMTLLPGDIISTGTPPGVGLGQKPPVYLKAGDVMQVGIEGLGEQRQVTRAWSRP
ncbi:MULTISPECIES: fumarylacetoacetate hydrolase family protein [unclassified Variovorax]|uniref:fumarylacetoacetate hydrolase family protein n=1 Tax=unclassified Variovorax TaxID=663243 RepID=UPI002578C154|nr:MULTISPECIES: fumarylacetoacetate hydrolase family protein [unclassified Variovorax]MDM0088875.1 fumarylacetoacetate hydrolase family protein [Variovorax sp. J22G40]MDM0146948.1 fumarylacetoacetate hydrolase family protein [Variovorax sp. J2P1-31]